MIVAIIGIGLIGGSMAISIKENGFADTVIGVDRSQDNLDKAIRRRLIDEDLSLEVAMSKADIVVLAIPVDAMLKVAPTILDQVQDHQVLIDLGSTKEQLAKAVASHPKRKRMVLAHPMAGTEFSGPEAAIPNLYTHRSCVICDQADSDKDAVQKTEALFTSMDMNLLYMNSVEHDMHAAYVSHISHITSFALALTVLKKEENEKRIFQLASGGFESTVRLAKSSPDMWSPIFQQNRNNVLDVLEEQIHTLSNFRDLLKKGDFDTFYQLMEKANEIKRILG